MVLTQSKAEYAEHFFLHLFVGGGFGLPLSTFSFLLCCEGYVNVGARSYVLIIALSRFMVILCHCLHPELSFPIDLSL